ncbi:hypothetical protein N7470_003375 [Penicillium chermesinum]|nr:hypothetical protein N7470_003375 [Penicillium chermesinum]
MKGTILAYSLLAGTASAHMQMSKPYPIRSPLNKDSDAEKDYSYTNPLSSSGSDYPCKGYAKDKFVSVATYPQGSEQEMTLEGSATHDGGSCQLSLSYDQGETFKVIESMLGDCPIPKDYKFTIPSDAPDGDALLAWTWFNKVGNREMYMNCAMVTIGGGGASNTPNHKHDHKKPVHKEMSEDKKASHPPMVLASDHQMAPRDMDNKLTGFDSLPAMFVANVGDKSPCVTIEGETVDFPLPGDNVIGTSDGKGYKCSGSAPFLAAGSNDTKNAPSTKKTTDAKKEKDVPATPKHKDVPAPEKQKDATSTEKNMHKIAKSFGSSTADPRVASSEAGLSTEASTNNEFQNYVTGFACTSGEILCSPDGWSWAMCSNSRPIYMGSVAAGMSCRFGAMAPVPPTHRFW